MSRQVLDEKQKSIIWIAKGIAAIAIVACHCCHIVQDASLLNVVSNALMSFWIGLGVPVFYFFAGYFMNSDCSWLEFWKKKIVMVVIPWILTGTMVWLYVVLRKGGLSFEGWLGFVLLKESYLYFLTDLMLFYILTWVIREKKSVELLIVVLICVLFINEMYPMMIVEFLQKCNCLMYYVIFLLGKRASYEENFYPQDRKVGLVVIIVWMLLRFFEMNDWYPYSVLGSIVILSFGVMGVISIAGWLYATRMGIWLELLGEISFSIYLLHMPIAGIIANVLNRSEYLAPLTIFRPIIVICITVLFIRVYVSVFKQPIFKVLIGYRK